MKEIILSSLEAGIAAKRHCIENNVDNIIKATDMLVSCMTSGNKVLIFGNGGSAADAQHLAAEFVNRFQIERPPLAAIALTTDTSILTSIGNDYHFNEIFSKQIKALGKQGDIAWGISTSGNSQNVIRAVEQAHRQDVKTLGLLGKGGGALRDLVDMALVVPSSDTQRVQEVHITVGHIFCEVLEGRALAASITGMARQGATS